MKQSCVIGIVALVLVSAAAGANSASFSDEWDALVTAPDLYAVSIESDDNGNVTVRAAVPNWLRWHAFESIVLVLDTDQHPDTGSAFYGTEYAAELGAHGVEFFGASGDSFKPTAAPASFDAALRDSVATFRFRASDLGISTGFNVVAVTRDWWGLFEDHAPNLGTFNYQLVAGTPAPDPGADKRPPQIFPEPSSGVHGKTANLEYMVADGRGETRQRFTVYLGTKRLTTIAYALTHRTPFYYYSARWKVPKTVKGRLRFCAQAWDAAGNSSSVNCEALVIR